MVDLRDPRNEQEDEGAKPRGYKWKRGIYDLPFFLMAKAKEHREAREDAEFKESLPNVTGVTLDSQKDLGILNRKLRSCEASVKSKKNMSTAIGIVGGLLTSTVYGATIGIPLLLIARSMKKGSEKLVQDGEKLNQDHAEMLENAPNVRSFQEPSSFLGAKQKPELSNAVIGAMPQGVGILDKQLRKCERELGERKTLRDTLFAMAAPMLCFFPLGGVLLLAAGLLVDRSANSLREEGAKLNNENADLIKESSLSPFESPKSNIESFVVGQIQSRLPQMFKSPPNTPKR